MDVSITIPAQTVTIPSQSVDVTIPAAKIVYQNAWLNQTSAISNTAIFTTSGEGLFRLTVAILAVGSGICSAYTSLAVPGTGVSASSAYSPSNSPAQVNYPATAVFAGSTGGGDDIYLQAANYGSITYYDLYVTIEQIQ